MEVKQSSGYLNGITRVYPGASFSGIPRDVFREGFLGVKSFLRKKSQNPLKNFPFHTKIFQNPSLEKFLNTPLDIPLPFE